jgi:hypothetical protein
LVGGLVVGTINWQKPLKKFDFVGRQQCDVKDRDHLKANAVNFFVSYFFMVPFT